MTEKDAAFTAFGDIKINGDTFNELETAEARVMKKAKQR
jgi:hypothetical protein